MKKYNIDDYDVFIFDFDGTIMDTEGFHYKSYLRALQSLDPKITLNQDDFFRLVHDIDKTEFHKLLKKHEIFDDYDKLYQLKGEYYKENIIKNYVNYIGNIDNFLPKLKSRKKKIIMVTNSSINSINLFKTVYPILNLFDKIYTKEDFKEKKPHPECYLKVQEMYKDCKMIGFEDSNVGMHSLSQAKLIKPIHIASPNYYYNERIKKEYDVEVIHSYDCFN